MGSPQTHSAFLGTEHWDKIASNLQKDRGVGMGLCFGCFCTTSLWKVTKRAAKLRKQIGYYIVYSYVLPSIPFVTIPPASERDSMAERCLRGVAGALTLQVNINICFEWPKCILNKAFPNYCCMTVCGLCRTPIKSLSAFQHDPLQGFIPRRNLACGDPD